MLCRARQRQFLPELFCQLNTKKKCRGTLVPSLPTGVGTEVWGQPRLVWMTAGSRGFATPPNQGSLTFIVVVIKYIIRASSSSAKQDYFLKLRSKRHITPPTKLIELSEVCVLSFLMAFKAHECYCNCFITQINKESPNMPCLPQGKGIKSSWVTAFLRSFCPPNKGNSL